MGDDLGADGGGGWCHFERWLHEKPAHAAEIHCRKKVFEVDVQHPALAGVGPRVGGDAFRGNKAVRVGMRLVEFVEVGLELVLQFTHEAVRGMDGPHAAGALGDLEGTIADVLRRLVERPQHTAERHVEVLGNIARAFERLAVQPERRRRWCQRGRQGFDCACLRHPASASDHPSKCRKKASRPSYLTHPYGRARRGEDGHLFSAAGSTADIEGRDALAIILPRLSAAKVGRRGCGLRCVQRPSIGGHVGHRGGTARKHGCPWGLSQWGSLIVLRPSAMHSWNVRGRGSV